MAIALIFAGGTGKRMNTRSKPKQFLEIHGKPVIIYTLEHFEYHEGIESILVVCVKEYIEELKGLLKRFDITKVKKIVPGGETGHDSIYQGLLAMGNFTQKDDIVLIHDGVRPLIDEELITLNIDTVRKYGNAITCEADKESQIRSLDGRTVFEMPPREQMYTAKAPQSFYYGAIKMLYEMAEKDGIKSIDSAQLCSLYHKELYMVKSTSNNMKITEPADFYICRALYDAQEGQQVFGI
ncbi:NTP transferase domain-containing protein [Lachnospiraceae bacterium WCA-9-b2]|mgnify:FL=1|jgi:2-C-methyl-D-erythritol 4-phosphate cytidylyltransferase|uniref:NTP transferase domain-containing protein n=1 Tax=Sporofaciens musculi TaxID=2681861 RepID=A0A7X3MGL1_9FIRM|nr:IspD/TarI family cytidylyltransferase [Sporofaciens musculi]MCI8362969.1 2-C-methyl-D-erythritol 4-phosphate cytidylyltransferase [Clostridia bacterium]MXP75872.1 NTP transferase domain-containing protein [Sporofaciens musculi]